MAISQRDFDLLDGLKSCGHAYVAASEAEDALRLADDDLVEIWTTATGFHAWRLTDKGRQHIESAKAERWAIV